MRNEKSVEADAVERFTRDTAEWMSAMTDLLNNLIASQNDLVEVVESLAAEVEALRHQPPDGVPGMSREDARRALMAQAVQVRSRASELGRQSQRVNGVSESLRNAFPRPDTAA